jgi:hypothetical protein
MRFILLPALTFGIWIMLTQGQPKQRIVQPKGTANAQKSAATDQKQQPSESELIQRLITEELRLQQQNTQILQAEKAQAEQDVTVQRNLVKYTGLLVLVGFVQAVVFGFTLWMIKRQADIMREHAGHLENLATAAGENAQAALLSAQAIANQTEHLRDTAVRQLRAYVGVDSAVLKFPQPGVPEAQVHFRNFGQTPAYDFRVWIHTWFAAYPLQESVPTAPNGLKMGINVLGPGRTSIMAAPKKPPLPPQNLALLGTTQFTLYVYGEVRYRDIFGEERRTEYRLIYGGAEGVRQVPDKEEWFLGPDTEGNKAT